MAFRGVLDFKPRHQPQLNGLAGQRIGARNHRLARDHGGHDGKYNHRKQRPIRKHQEERIFERLRISQNERALSQIVQRQRRQYNDKPGGLDRPFAKVPEVGIERLGSGNGEKHRAERNEADNTMMQHERDGVERIQRKQNFGCCMIGEIAAIAMTANHTHMIGPKKAATRAVPRDCTANSTSNITTVSATTYGSNAAVTRVIPSIAERTETAGVITASP